MRFTRIVLIATAALAAGLFAFPAPASADGGHGHGHGNGHGNGHGESNGHSHSYGPAHGYGAYPTVPRSIVVGHRGYYQPYHNGRVYYAPHLAFGINFGSPGGASFGGFYSSPGYAAPAPYPYVAYPAPAYRIAPPYYGPDVYYRGRHCDHGNGDYDGY
jgi:hypothetical protein